MSWRVLVVDDDLESCAALATLLGLAGHVVRMAASGAEGMEVARIFQPDVVCTDICMPGLSGAELCQRLKRDPQTSAATIIALTALSAETWHDFDEAGFAAILSKPLSFESINAQIEEAHCASPTRRHRSQQGESR